MTTAATTATAGGLASVVQVAGLAAFFAGIAVGLLFVFADRHGYEPPAPPRVVGALLVAGTALTLAGEVGTVLGI